ncbi:LysR family transcriptional regulator ArgP [Acinetobacter sp. WZC-1]|uniref:LysR family transcriptional regulator ArgP n=1 Tax=Acinetobacter sp. WZC-1 TaxID=3459034 RepID=UPI00403DCC34
MLQSKQSEAFLAVAETGSFELAAAKLCITSSAVTLRVQSLEKSLGHILIVRERPCRVTSAGQALLQCLQHTRLMEQNLMQRLMGQSDTSACYKVSIASNADSLATWLLPALQQTLLREHIVLELKIEDQTQTYALLENGLVNACISTESQSMPGCLAEPLGKMYYRMVATPEFHRKWFAQGINRQSLKTAPSVIFNSKDHIHTEILSSQVGLPENSYPCHYIPSSTAFVEAIELGLGYGMVPEFQLGNSLENGTLLEIMPDARTAIMLYWHHWKRPSAPMQQLTVDIINQAQQILSQ